MKRTYEQPDIVITELDASSVLTVSKESYEGDFFMKDNPWEV